MTATGDPLWERLSAPVKAAVRWARASAHARTGVWGNDYDSLDLLVGVLLADLTGNPAKQLFEHFGIAVSEVLDSPGAAPPTATALLATDTGPPPSWSPANREIFHRVRQLAEDTAEPVTLPQLFGALLSSESSAALKISDALGARQVHTDRIQEVYAMYLDGMQPLSEVLAREIPCLSPEIFVPDYLADQPEVPTDLVGIGAEVDAFAHLIASKRLTPPLAVGLFGDWGSGKSYFLGHLRNRIKRVADAQLPTFHRSIVQVEFNAWQYVGTDLWAGLIEHLFQHLQLSGIDSDDLIAHQHQADMRQIQAADTEYRQAQRQREELQEKHETAANEVKHREEDLTRAAKALEDARQPSRALKTAIRQAAEHAGLRAPVDSAAELASELKQATEDLRSLLTPLRDKRYLTLTIIALVLTPAIAYFAKQIDLSAVSTVTWLLTAAAGYVAAAGKFVRDTKKKIAEAQARLTEAEQAEVDRIQQETRAARERFEQVKSDLDSAVAREQELAGKVEGAKRRLAANTPGQVLIDYLEGRLESDDYRRHLGVPALVRRDLERLSRLLKAQGDASPIGRIVLYIDDLDRCPTPVVIKVLEAVHLMLAFPLFVVVVAVDARWLTSSLREHYRQLAGPDASPADYLEKIFQVPFRVQPLPTHIRERMVRGLLTPSLTIRTSEPVPLTEANEVVLSDVSLDLFHQVIDSFTAGPRRALSSTIDLTITGSELEQIQDVAELIGATPRVIKRFANVYLLVKSIGTGHGWTLPADGQVAIFLAVAVGLPRLAGTLFPAAKEVDKLIDAVPTQSEGDERFREWVTKRGREDVPLAGLGEWLELIDRFRFPEGRSGAGPGRMDG